MHSPSVLKQSTAGRVCQWLLVSKFLLSKAAMAQELLWSDDFDSGGINSDFWSFDTGNGGWGNGELQTYSESNALVQDGLLKIIAQKDESYSPPTFTSARIKTQNKLSFKYGRLEARIKVPDVDAGLWPAFWTLGQNLDQVPWPASGEINIMEIGQGLAIEQGLANRRVVSAAHWDYQGLYATYASSYDSPVNLNDDFHVYRLEWTPESMTTFVDDAMIWQMNIGSENCNDCEELHQPHFILLNVAVGGGFTSGSSSSSSSGSSSSGCGGSSNAGSSSSGGCPTRGPDDITAPFPAEMLVDWVRLYDNGHCETNLPTPQPTATTTANAQTAPPTMMPIMQPTPATVIYTPEPTFAPVAQPIATPEPTEAVIVIPAATPSPTEAAVVLPVATPRPTQASRPTGNVLLPDTPPPVSGTSLDSWEDDYATDDDCILVSGSADSGEGKGGKSGKAKSGKGSSGSYRSGSSGSSDGSGGKAGGKDGKGTRRRRLDSGKGGKGKGGHDSGSRASGDSRCGGGSARVTQNSLLAADATSSAATSPAMRGCLFLVLVGLAGVVW